MDKAVAFLAKLTSGQSIELKPGVSIRGVSGLEVSITATEAGSVILDFMGYKLQVAVKWFFIGQLRDIKRVILHSDRIEIDIAGWADVTIPWHEMNDLF